AHRSLLRVIDAVDDIEHRRLAGPVGADDGADLALQYVEADVGECLDPAEGQRHVVHREQDSTDAARSAHAARFCSMRNTLASRILTSAAILPRRPSSNFTSVSMRQLCLLA